MTKSRLFRRISLEDGLTIDEHVLDTIVGRIAADLGLVRQRVGAAEEDRPRRLSGDGGARDDERTSPDAGRPRVVRRYGSHAQAG